jgi:hypothetical protein
VDRRLDGSGGGIRLWAEKTGPSSETLITDSALLVSSASIRLEATVFMSWPVAGMARGNSANLSRVGNATPSPNTKVSPMPSEE